jgi:hypothetical protein
MRKFLCATALLVSTVSSQADMLMLGAQYRMRVCRTCFRESDRRYKKRKKDRASGN